MNTLNGWFVCINVIPPFLTILTDPPRKRVTWSAMIRKEFRSGITNEPEVDQFVSLYTPRPCPRTNPGLKRHAGVQENYAKPKMLHNVFEINSKFNRLQFRSRAEIENCTLFNAEYSIPNHNFVRFVRHSYIGVIGDTVIRTF